ncbi:MAG TPA: hypothetical protein VG711_06005, partial [Phycisphaerales bacterium]|nr:hypothetical protein [Phycisphaerales bacterium]
MAFSERERAVCEWIAGRESAMRADVATYVAIPTGWNYTQGLNEFRGLMAQRLKELGASVEETAGDEKPAWLEHSVAKAGTHDDKE